MPQKMVAVHYANRSGRGKAAFFLPHETAHEMVDARLAEWGKGGKYINLKKAESEMWRTAKSLMMGPDVMEAAAQGDDAARACRDGWMPCLVAP
jgi:hypothetical protein